MNNQEIIEKYRKYEPFFGNWYINQFIGSGGFAKVFKISRKDFGDEYTSALKIITVSLNESEIKERQTQGMSIAEIKGDLKNMVQDTVNEIKVMYKLKGCQNIVSYEDHAVIESEDGMSCDILIKMELLTPLNDYIIQNGGKINERMFLKLGIDICRALELCQKHKIIHRDIKFENIFISNNGDFKLGDFGIARVLESQNSGLSKKGTSNYMAPEVYKGLTYGSAVDIYSLGMVMYRILNNNRDPFLPPYPEAIALEQRDNAMIQRMSGEKLPKPNELKSGRLCEIVLKACEYLPENRYSSPLSMRNELESIAYEKGELTDREVFIRIFDVKNENENYGNDLGVTEILQKRTPEKIEKKQETLPKKQETLPEKQEITEKKRKNFANNKNTVKKESKDEDSRKTVKKSQPTVKSKKAEGKAFSKKAKGIILSAIILLALAVLSPLCASAYIQNMAPEKLLEFKLNDDEDGYTVVYSYLYRFAKEIEIPSEYNELPVTAIDEKAFYQCKKIQSVTIPESVLNIGESAFSSCDDLTEIIFESTDDWYDTENNLIDVSDSEQNVVFLSEDNSLTKITAESENESKETETTEPSTESAQPEANSNQAPPNPNDPSNPAPTTLPSNPAETTNSNHQTQPSTPSTPVTPTQPSQSTKPEQTTKPVQSTQPSKPNEPSQPTQTTQPSRPAETTKPSTGSANPNTSSGSQGLAFEKDSSGKGYVVVGIGTCKDSNVAVPSQYNGMNVTTIGDYAFNNCKSVTSITLPSTIKSIGSSAFKNSSLKSITVPGSVTSIGANAFYSAKSLSSVTLSEGLTQIGDSAFNWCTSLKSIAIPKSVTKIGSDVFVNCTGLDSLSVNSRNTKYSSSGNCIIEKSSKKLVIGCKNSVIPSDGSVTTIGKAAFLSCKNLKSITIPNSVTVIEERAYSNCENLSSVTLGSSVKSIGQSAFGYCNLTTVVIPKSVTTIYALAFSGNNLSSVQFEAPKGWYADYSSSNNNDGFVDFSDSKKNAEILKDNVYLTKN